MEKEISLKYFKESLETILLEEVSPWALSKGTQIDKTRTHGDTMVTALMEDKSFYSSICVFPSKRYICVTLGKVADPVNDKIINIKIPDYLYEITETPDSE